MTGQSLLDRMELLNQELQLQSGEADVTRGLLALNVAQDYFEGLAAARAKVFGSQTGTMTITQSTESTAWPTGLLRLDRIQVLGANSRPSRELRPLRRAGGHATVGTWPLNLVIGSGSGSPTHYWTNGTNLYWSPLPSATETARWYGFQAASDISASGTFTYPDLVALPLAVFAVRLHKLGLEDNLQDLNDLAMQTFNPVLDTLELYNRDGAVGLEYTEVHDA
jgi:hypothetical protein